MNELLHGVETAASPAYLNGAGQPAPVQPASGPGLLTRLVRLLRGAVPTLITLAAVAGLVLLGVRTGWKLPKFSVLMGKEQEEKKDWCDEHRVPDSICVECKKDCLPRAPEHGWCRKHGIAECPLCYPEVAQLQGSPKISAEDLERASEALKFAPRVENNSKCKLHLRRIQLASEEIANKLGVEVVPVGRGAVTDELKANGEVGFDRTRYARIISRLSGVVWRVERQIGEKVRAGDVLAVIDAVQVGKAKAEFLEALAQEDLKVKTLASYKASPETVSGQTLSEAQATVEDARIRRMNAEQTLANLDLPIRADDLKDLSADELSRRIRFLGLPYEIVRSLDPAKTTGNLIAVKAPLDGMLMARDDGHVPTVGESVDAEKVLFVVADTQKMWLTLEVRLEDARKFRIGQTVHFRPDGGDEVSGKLTWLSPSVDEKTRTIKVRAELPNTDNRLLARAFGTGHVVLREEKDAIVVPSEAVHWEGDCNIVFVRDKNYEQTDGPKVFHVRKVRPGAKSDGKTEIIAGLLPGELVVTAGSGTFRSELLRGNLGAG